MVYLMPLGFNAARSLAATQAQDDGERKKVDEEAPELVACQIIPAYETSRLSPMLSRSLPELQSQVACRMVVVVVTKSSRFCLPTKTSLLKIRVVNTMVLPLVTKQNFPTMALCMVLACQLPLAKNRVYLWVANEVRLHHYGLDDGDGDDNRDARSFRTHHGINNSVPLWRIYVDCSIVMIPYSDGPMKDNSGYLSI